MDLWESASVPLEDAEKITASMHAHSFPAALGASRCSVWHTKSVKRVLDVAGGSVSTVCTYILYISVVVSVSVCSVLPLYIYVVFMSLTLSCVALTIVTIYQYVCVCVCVCVKSNPSTLSLSLFVSLCVCVIIMSPIFRSGYSIRKCVTAAFVSVCIRVSDLLCTLYCIYMFVYSLVHFI